jgi:hypothetical protein
MCGSGGTAPSFFISVLPGGEWSASRPCRFAPLEAASGTDYTGYRIIPRADQDAVEVTLLGIEPKYLSPKPIAVPNELSTLR